MVAWLARVTEAFFEGRRARRAMGELARMDDATLRDLGIERGMVEAVARDLAARGRREGPTGRLGAVLSRRPAAAGRWGGETDPVCCG